MRRALVSLPGSSAASAGSDCRARAKEPSVKSSEKSCRVGAGAHFFPLRAVKCPAELSVLKPSCPKVPLDLLSRTFS